MNSAFNPIVTSDKPRPSQAASWRSDAVIHGPRLLVFGGTFDPPTTAHTFIAATAANALGVDQTLWVPNQISPWKQGEPLTAPEHRIAMINAAIAGHVQMSVCTLETDVLGPSYTFETLASLRRAAPMAQLWFLCGADVLSGLPSFKNALEIVSHVRIAAFDRPGYAAVEQIVCTMPPLWQAAIDPIVTPTPVDVSSTAIRKRLQEGRSVSGLITESIENYIKDHGLYR